MCFMSPLRARLRVAPILACLSLACTSSPEPTSSPVSAPVDPTSLPSPIEHEFIDLALETSWGCAVHRSGTVYCWGDDPAAALGLRKPTDDWGSASVVEGLTGVVDIAADLRRLCAVNEGGEVSCLIHGEHPIPEHVVLDLSDIVELESNYDSCARDRGGAVYCWSDPIAPRRKLVGGAIDIDLELYRGCALDGEGAIWCWSDDAPTTKLAELPGARSLALGIDDICVSLGDGSVSCAALDESTAAPPTFEPVAQLEHVTALERIEAHACALIDDGGVRCFGENGWAQLGDGSSVPRDQPVTVSGLGEASALAVAASLSCAIDEHGIACWGTHNTDTFDRAPIEQRRPLTGVSGVVISHTLSCATTSPGSGLWCWGLLPAGELGGDPGGIFRAAQPTKVGLPEIGAVVELLGADLLDDAGELRRGSFEPVQMRATVGDAFSVKQRRSQISDFASGSAECVISQAKLLCDDPYGGQPVLDVPKLRRPSAVYGDHFDFYVVHDGGQLSTFSIHRGAGNRMRASAPQRIGSFSGVRSLFDARARGTCALDGNGQIWCWWSITRALAGKLEQLDGLPPGEEAAAYAGTICVRTADGRVACRDHTSTEPEWLDTDNAVALAGGAVHLCVREADGGLLCVGQNGRGELGVLPATVMAEPLRISIETASPQRER